MCCNWTRWKLFIFYLHLFTLHCAYCGWDVVLVRLLVVWLLAMTGPGLSAAVMCSFPVRLCNWLVKWVVARQSYEPHFITVLIIHFVLLCHTTYIFIAMCVVCSMIIASLSACSIGRIFSVASCVSSWVKCLFSCLCLLLKEYIVTG